MERDGGKVDVKGQPDPTAAQHADTQDTEPDVVNPIDSHALLQPGTAGAGNTLSSERLMVTAARANKISLFCRAIILGYLGGTF